MAISNIRGSIRVSSRGVTAADLATKLTNSIATDRLWGRDTAGTGGSEALTVGGGLSFTGSGGIQISTSGVVTAKLADNSVTAIKIGDDNVTSGKIAPLAVITSRIADGNVTTAKLGDNSVTAIKIADDNVTSGKIAPLAVITSRIADLSVTTEKLATSGVTGIKIAAGTVEAGHLAGNAVTADKIASGAVTAVKIAASAVVEASLATGAVTQGKLGAAAVTTDKIASGAVTEVKIAANAVVEASLATGAVTQGKLGAAAVSTAKIADDNVTTAKLANDAVTQLKIADSAVGTAQIIAGNVTAAKLADLNVTTAKLADGAVTESKLGSGAVTAGKIATGAVGQSELQTDAVTVGKIDEGAVTNNTLADGAVSAEKIDGSAITPALISTGFGSATEVTAITAGARFATRTSGVLQMVPFSALRTLLRAENLDSIYQPKATVLTNTTAAFTEDLKNRIGDITDIESKVIEALTTPEGFPGRTAAVGGSTGTVLRYTTAATGASHLVAPLALSTTVRTIAADRGRELRLTGAKEVYTTMRQPVYPGETWEFVWRFIRRTDPTDPSGDAVQPIIVCLNYQHAEVARFEFDDPPFDDIKIVDGLQTFKKIISSSAGSGIDAVWPASTVHIVAGFKTFGTDGQTSLQVMDLRNLTDLMAWSPSTTSFDARLVALEATDLTGVDGRLDIIESRFGSVDLYDPYRPNPAADLTREDGTPYDYVDGGATALIHAGELLIIRAGDGVVVDQYPGIRPALWVKDSARFSTNMGVSSGGGYPKTQIGGGLGIVEVGDSADFGAYIGITEGEVHGAEITPIIPIGGRSILSFYGGFLRGGDSAGGFETGPISFSPPEFNISFFGLNWGGRIRFDSLPEVPHSISPNSPGLRRAQFEVRGTPAFNNTIGCETALRLWWTEMSGETMIETQRIIRAKKEADLISTDLVLYVRGTST